MNIGQAYLKISNPDDISSYEIYHVDDVFEVSPNENVYECTIMRFNYEKGYKITKNQN